MNRQLNASENKKRGSAVPNRAPVPHKSGGAARAVLTVSVLLLVLALALTTVTYVFKKLEQTPLAELDMPNMVSRIPTVQASDRLSAADVNAAIDISEYPEPEPVNYNFAAPVPKSPAVSASYFSDTVFIGDSRTQGLILYTDLKPLNFASQGANVSNIQTRKFVALKNEDGKYVNHTLADALEKKKGEYKAVYISMGVNELGWSVSKFAEQYYLLVDTIRGITDVPIYISLIMPVTAEFSEASDLKNSKAIQFNEKLREIALEKSLFLLDPTGIHTLEDGTLDPEHSYDGAHLWPASYKELADYYCTHTVNIYAYDNTRPAEEDTAEEGTSEAES